MKILLYLLMLPPFFESAREIQSLISHPRTAQLMGTSEPIMDIERTENGYVVRSRTLEMEVAIHYGGDQRMIGPAQFQFEFFEPHAIGAQSSYIPAN